MSRHLEFGMGYGASELKDVYRFNIIRGLLLAGIVHFSALSGLWILPQQHQGHVKPKSDSTIIVLWPAPGRQERPQVRGSNGARRATKEAVIPVLNPHLFNSFLPILEDNTPVDLSNGRSDLTASGDHWVGQPEGLGDEPFDPGLDSRVEKYPIPTKTVKPLYSEIAVKSGAEGTVEVAMLVGKNGRVRKAFVRKSANFLLDEAALQASYLWQFSPAMMGNDSVAVWTIVPFRFTLKRP